MPRMKEYNKRELLELASVLPCGLDLHEVIRKPREATPEEYADTSISLNDSGLRDEIRCPICAGIINKCVVIKTCLHRFCSSCIEKCVRVGARECPKCRRKVPSRRFLKPDPIYDSIISRVVPNVQVFEELCDTFTMAVNKGMRNDQNLDVFRENFLDENPKVDITTIHSIKNGVDIGGFSVASLFDTKVYIREIKAKRKAIFDSLPKIGPDNKLWYTLKAEDCVQITPSRFHDRGFFTIHHLGMYIKTHVNVPLGEEIYIYSKESQFIADPSYTVAYFRNKVLALSHECVTIYYSTRKPVFKKPEE